MINTTYPKKTMKPKPKTGLIDRPHPNPLPQGEGIVVQLNRHWSKALPNLKKKSTEIAAAAGAKNVTIRFAEDDEVKSLNKDFRGQNKPTNVLSFPSDDGDYQGDIILARGVVFAEAKAQKKDPLHHTLHLVAHGVLHLLGYDHMNAKDAKKMESLEIKILAQFGIENPYE